MPQGWTKVEEPAAVPTGWTPVAEAPPDFRAINEPPSTALKAVAYGKDALQLALDVLPGAGAVVGGALATPETMGGGTLVGAALGAGAGRGLRDLVAAGLGLQKPSTAIAEGGTIAMDAGETYAAGFILPALWEAIKAPGATVGDVIDRTRILYKALPKAAKAFLPDFEALAKLPKGVAKAPAAILERPAWQTWQEHLPDAQPSPQVTRTTGTSMIPAAVPPRPVSPPPAAPIAISPAVSIEPAAAVAPAEVPVARPTNTLPDQKALNEARLAEIRAAYQDKLRAAAAAPPPPPAEPIVAASGKMKLTGPEMVEFNRLKRTGLSLSDAYARLMDMRTLAARLGGATPEQMAADMAHRRYKS